MNPFELRQRPSPSNSPQQPNAQFCAVGGFSQRTSDALHCHKTELAAAQPAPWPLLPRFARLKLYNVEDDYVSRQWGQREQSPPYSMVPLVGEYDLALGLIAGRMICCQSLSVFNRR